MPLPDLTYARYAELGGTHDEGTFEGTLRAAVASVREIIGFNCPETGEQIKAYERAVCAAVDVDVAYGASAGIGEDLASVSIGSFSASMSGDSASSGYKADMRRAIRRELAGSGLLYQGIG